MIYCVRFSKLEAELSARGFVRVIETEASIVFTDGTDILTLRQPNADLITEQAMNNAFDAAGLEPPTLEVEWCD